MNRIVGGTAIDPNQYPWLCSLKNQDGNHVCGITLLGLPPHYEKTILVGAAQCYEEGQKYRIVCGEHLLDTQDSTEIAFDVTQVIVHPRFQKGSGSLIRSFDIAVYKVDDDKANVASRPEVTAKKVFPACLPYGFQDISIGSNLWIAGWGLLRERRIRVRKL